MNILYVAVSCDPYNGSEDKIGWNVPWEMSKTENVWIVTRRDLKKSIDKFLGDNEKRKLKMVYVEMPEICNKVFKGMLQSAKLLVWQRKAYPIVEKICRNEKIDIIHQITPIEFRAIGKYGKIEGVKFICGPLGGGEYIPSGLKKYAFRSVLMETIRKMINVLSRRKLIKKKKIAQCDYIMFANSETKEFLLKRYKDNEILRNIQTEVVSEIAIDKKEIIEKKVRKNKKVIFLVAGRMIYRKGHRFLIDALKKIPKDLEYECRIVGVGPELKKIQRECNESKLSEKVVFVGSIPYTKMQEQYLEADVLIMPSIRETTGSVLLEALSKGLPIITIARFGENIILDNDCAWLYDGRDNKTFVESLTEKLIECIENCGEIENKSINAIETAKKYTWQNKGRHYHNIYTNIVRKE